MTCAAPFVYEEAGRFLMLWSSFSSIGYAMGVLESVDGRIDGRWVSRPKPLFANDGGHGMRFRGFDGKIRYTVHRPNRSPNERPVFFTLP